MSGKQTYFIVLRESVIKSWARDLSVFALFASLIGIGIFLDSSAMQWTGAIVGFVIILSRASGKRKDLTKDEAIKFIQEMGDA